LRFHCPCRGISGAGDWETTAKIYQTCAEGKDPSEMFRVLDSQAQLEKSLNVLMKIDVGKDK